MNISKNKDMVYALLAYAFTLFLHMLWIRYAATHPEFFHNGHLMINNIDGYYFLANGRDLLQFNFSNPRFSFDGMTIMSALFGANEGIAVYISAIVGSLTAIVAYYLYRLYVNEVAAFLGALVASLAWSYYTRTVAGYYDTDMFNILLPLTAIYLHLTGKRFYAALTFALFDFIYNSGIYVTTPIVALILLLERRLDPIYVVALGGKWAFIGVLILKYLPKYRLLFALAFATLFNPIPTHLWHKVALYLGLSDGGVWRFYNVNKTINETSHLPYYYLFNRMGGSLIGTLLAFAGYFWLVFRRRELLITLPFFFLAMSAFFFGMRFTFYAAPIVGLGTAYLVDRIRTGKIPLGVVAGLFVLFPNVIHITGFRSNDIELMKKSFPIYPLALPPYTKPTVLKDKEVEAIEKIKGFTLSWWDYGYPIRYYADVKTLVDGGNHFEDSYLAALALTTDDENLTRKIALLSAKLYDGKHHVVYKILENNLLKKEAPNTKAYVYLPIRMAYIFPVIRKFVVDLHTGKPLYPKGVFIPSKFVLVKDALVTKYYVYDGGYVRSEKRVLPVKKVVVLHSNKVEYQKDLSPKGLYLIIDRDKNFAILMDRSYYDSFFIKAMTGRLKMFKTVYRNADAIVLETS